MIKFGSNKGKESAQTSAVKHICIAANTLIFAHGTKHGDLHVHKSNTDKKLGIT